MFKNLLDILQENEIEVHSSSGGRYVANCPFHKDDNTPSFTIYPEMNYFCFGCDRWGDSVKFLVEFKGMTQQEAQDYVGVGYIYTKADKTRVIKVTNISQTWGFLNRVTGMYHANLMRTPGAFDYLISRGLIAETIYQHKVGYSDGNTIRLSFATDYALAHEAGILTKNGFELMSHRITIPNFVDTHHVDFIIGRTVVNDRIKYLGTRLPKPVYGFAKNSKSPILFLAEGQFDWMLLSQWGYPAVVLSGGHLAKYHLNLFRDKFVVIVPDNDEAGTKTASSLHVSLPNSYILDYSKLNVKDIGELGPMSDGEKLFSEIVKEQLWEITRTSSKETWEKYLTNFTTVRFSA